MIPDKGIKQQVHEGKRVYKKGAWRAMGCTSCWGGFRRCGRGRCATSQSLSGVLGGQQAWRSECRVCAAVCRGSWRRENRLHRRLAGAWQWAGVGAASAQRGMDRMRLGDTAGRDGCGARDQAPVVTVRACAREASRTKRATLPARSKMSPRQAALALLGKPNQGERLRPRRCWPALRLSA